MAADSTRDFDDAVDEVRAASYWLRVLTGIVAEAGGEVRLSHEALGRHAMDHVEWVNGDDGESIVVRLVPRRGSGRG